MNKEKSRRHFLTVATLTAGGALLAAPPGATAAKTVTAKPPTTAPARGYQKTEHVRRYYQLARQL